MLTRLQSIVQSRFYRREAVYNLSNCYENGCTRQGRLDLPYLVLTGSRAQPLTLDVRARLALP